MVSNDNFKKLFEGIVGFSLFSGEMLDFYIGDIAGGPVKQYL